MCDEGRQFGDHWRSPPLGEPHNNTYIDIETVWG